MGSREVRLHVSQKHVFINEGHEKALVPVEEDAQEGLHRVLLSNGGPAGGRRRLHVAGIRSTWMPWLRSHVTTVLGYSSVEEDIAGLDEVDDMQGIRGYSDAP